MHSVLNQRTNRSFSIKADESVLDAALRQGVSFPYGCQKGLCGRCKGLLISGQVNYPDPLPRGITDEEIEAGVALFCQAHPSSDLIIEAEELADEQHIEITRIKTTIISINKLNHDVVELVLQTPAEQTLQFLSGQYVDIYFDDIAPRSFSIANAANNDGVLSFHIRLIKDGVFSNALINRLKTGDSLSVEGPKGSFYLREKSTKPIIMVAGGTGLGPIKAMIEHYLTQSNNRQINLYWGVNQLRDFYYVIPQQWRQKINFTPVLSKPDDDWPERSGLVHQAVLADFADLSTYEVYVCGAPIMIDVARVDFIKQGLTEKDFYADSFEYSGV